MNGIRLQESEINFVFCEWANIVRPYALYSQFGGPRKALAF